MLLWLLLLLIFCLFLSKAREEIAPPFNKTVSNCVRGVLLLLLLMLLLLLLLFFFVRFLWCFCSFVKLKSIDQTVIDLWCMANKINGHHHDLYATVFCWLNFFFGIHFILLPSFLRACFGLCFRSRLRQKLVFSYLIGARYRLHNMDFSSWVHEKENEREREWTKKCLESASIPINHMKCVCAYNLTLAKAMRWDGWAMRDSQLVKLTLAYALLFYWCDI